MHYDHGFPVDVWSALQVDSHYHLLPLKYSLYPYIHVYVLVQVPLPDGIS